MDRVKRRPMNFQAGVDGRQLRAHRRSVERRSLRRSVFDQNRDHLASLEALPEEEVAEPVALPLADVVVPPLSRREMLKRFKEEKALKRKLEAEKRAAKPVFKVCHLESEKPLYLRNSLASNAVVPPRRRPAANASADPAVLEKRVTRSASAAAKAISAATGTAAAPPVAAVPREKRVVPALNKRQTRSTRTTEPKALPILTGEVSFAPKNFEFQAPAILNRSAIPPQLNEDTALCKATTSKATEADPQPELCAPATETDTQPELCSPAYSDLPLGVPRFRNLLLFNTTRLRQQCDEWALILNNEKILSDDVVGRIRSVVGKANLLIRERFDQFSKLVDDCEFNRGDKVTNYTDLQGFWEMIFPQVDECFENFKKLTRIRSNGFLDEVTPLKFMTRAKRGSKTKVDRKSASKATTKLDNAELSRAARQRLAEFRKAAAAERKKTSENSSNIESRATVVVATCGPIKSTVTDPESPTHMKVSISTVLSSPTHCAVEIIDLNKSGRRDSLCRSVRQKNFVDNVMAVVAASQAAAESGSKSPRRSRRQSGVFSPMNILDQLEDDETEAVGLSPFGALKINSSPNVMPDPGTSLLPKLNRKSDLIRFSDAFSMSLDVDKENSGQNPLAAYLKASAREHLYSADSSIDE